jgi:hypothetical protein
MDELVLHEPPATRAALGEQLRTVGLGLRREGAVLLLALLGLSLLIAYMYLHSRHTGGGFFVTLSPETSGPLALVAMVLPIAVWKGEEPSRRSYLWSLPVPRGPHTLGKVFFGWVWMSAGLALFVAWSLAVPLLVHASAVGKHGPPAPAAWRWAVPFTACTVTYLLGTVAVLLSDHPWRWLVGLSVAFLLVRGVSAVPGMEAVHDAVDGVWSARYGLQAALTGRVEVLKATYQTGGRVMHSYRSVVSEAGWLGATALWLALGLGATTFAAFHHQERTR